MNNIVTIIILKFFNVLQHLAVMVMSYGTICNDDFKCNTALQCWSNVVTIPNNVVNHLVQHYL